MGKIEFTIDKKTGLITGETTGFEGKECVKELNFLRAVSGDEPDVDFKDDGQENYVATTE